MKQFGCAFVVCVLVSVAASEDETKTNYKTSTTSSKLKEPSTIRIWGESATTKKWQEPTTPTKWKQPTTTTKSKESTTTPRWKQPSTTTKWKEPTTTTRWKQPPTTTKWKEPTTTTHRWKQLTTTRATPTYKKSPPAINNVVAIASFSDLDSRNGRLSSMNGIKIFPPVDPSMVKSDDKGNFVFKSVNGEMPMPITITKQGDGVSGTIRILPGSVSVSSSASSKSGPASSMASYGPWPTPIMKPMINDVYFPPFPTFPTIPDPMFDSRFADSSFHSRISDPFPRMRIPEPTFHMQDPWFEKSRFKDVRPKYEMFKPSWYYPSFDPFINYW